MTQLDQMITILEEMGPLNAYEIAAEMGVSRQRIDRMIRCEVQPGKPKRIYIAKYLVTPGESMRTKLWMAGNKRDAPRPAPIPKKEASRLARLRKKQQIEDDVERAIEEERMRRVREELSRPAFRHWMDVVFYGEHKKQEAA